MSNRVEFNLSRGFLEAQFWTDSWRRSNALELALDIGETTLLVLHSCRPASANPVGAKDPPRTLNVESRQASLLNIARGRGGGYRPQPSDQPEVAQGSASALELAHRPAVRPFTQEQLLKAFGCLEPVPWDSFPSMAFRSARAFEVNRPAPSRHLSTKRARRSSPGRSSDSHLRTTSS